MRTTVVIAVVAAAAAAAHAPAAHAATTCSLAAGLLEVTMTQHDDRAHLSTAAGAIAIGARGGVPVTCAGGTPTTTNTDTVLVVDNSDNPATPVATDGNTTLTLRDPASFAPGKTPEGTAGEIELFANMKDGVDDQLEVYAPPAGSNFTAGTGGFDWNGDRARELLGGPFDAVVLIGDAGSDAISAQGGGTTGGPLTTPRLVVYGGNGNDTLLGGNTPAGDDLRGEEGDDVLTGFAGNDDLEGAAGNDTVSGGAGSDGVYFHTAPAGVTVDLGRVDIQDTGEGSDSFAGIENAQGSLFADTLIGDGANNVLAGLAGDDTLDGRGGSDAMLGGPGADTLTFAQAPAAVVVDIAAKSAIQGTEADTFTEIENVIGSPFADTLAGDETANRIVAGAGADTVSGGAGNDSMEVRDGEADKVSCGVDADTVVADRRSLDTIAAPECEAVDALAEPRPATPDGPATPSGDSPSPAGTPDRSLSVVLTGARSQRLLAQRAVHVRVRSPFEASTVVARASGRLPRTGRGPAARLTIRPVTATVSRGATRTLRLRLTTASVRALRRAMAAKRQPTVTVTVRARDAAGNSVARTLRVQARR